MLDNSRTLKNEYKISNNKYKSRNQKILLSTKIDYRHTIWCAGLPEKSSKNIYLKCFKNRLALDDFYAFDEAIGKGLQLTSEQDTHIVVTADHGFATLSHEIRSGLTGKELIIAKGGGVVREGEPVVAVSPQEP